MRYPDLFRCDPLHRRHSFSWPRKGPNVKPIYFSFVLISPTQYKTFYVFTLDLGSKYQKFRTTNDIYTLYPLHYSIVRMRISSADTNPLLQTTWNKPTTHAVLVVCVHTKTVLRHSPREGDAPDQTHFLMACPRLAVSKWPNNTGPVGGLLVSPAKLWVRFPSLHFVLQLLFISYELMEKSSFMCWAITKRASRVWSFRF